MFGVQGYPRPYIARALRLHFWRAILFLRAHETPNFVTLNAPALEITKRLVLVVGTGAAEIAKQLVDCVAGNAGHSRGGTNGIAL